MTVCVAAIPSGGKNIVTIMDFMISTDSFSSDFAVMKGESLAASWYTMFAGDISPVTPIVEGV